MLIGGFQIKLEEDGFNQTELAKKSEEFMVYYQGVDGTPGVDFPIFSHIPRTSFSCKGIDSGYYADLDTDCQVFHICEEERKISFLCPNGTIFQQSDLICEWWFKVNCTDAPNLYEESVEQLREDITNRKAIRKVPLDGNERKHGAIMRTEEVSSISVMKNVKAVKFNQASMGKDNVDGNRYQEKNSVPKTRRYNDKETSNYYNNKHTDTTQKYVNSKSQPYIIKEYHLQFETTDPDKGFNVSPRNEVFSRRLETDLNSKANNNDHRQLNFKSNVFSIENQITRTNSNEQHIYSDVLYSSNPTINTIMAPTNYYKNNRQQHVFSDISSSPSLFLNKRYKGDSFNITKDIIDTDTTTRSSLLSKYNYNSNSNFSNERIFQSNISSIMNTSTQDPSYADEKTLTKSQDIQFFHTLPSLRASNQQQLNGDRLFEQDKLLPVTITPHKDLVSENKNGIHRGNIKFHFETPATECRDVLFPKHKLHQSSTTVGSKMAWSYNQVKTYDNEIPKQDTGLENVEVHDSDESQVPQESSSFVKSSFNSIQDNSSKHVIANPYSNHRTTYSKLKKPNFSSSKFLPSISSVTPQYITTQSINNGKPFLGSRVGANIHTSVGTINNSTHEVRNAAKVLLGILGITTSTRMPIEMISTNSFSPEFDSYSTISFIRNTSDVNSEYNIATTVEPFEDKFPIKENVHFQSPDHRLTSEDESSTFMPFSYVDSEEFIQSSTAEPRMPSIMINFQPALFSYPATSSENSAKKIIHDTTVHNLFTEKPAPSSNSISKDAFNKTEVFDDHNMSHTVNQNVASNHSNLNLSINLFRSGEKSRSSLGRTSYIVKPKENISEIFESAPRFKHDEEVLISSSVKSLATRPIFSSEGSFNKINSDEITISGHPKNYIPGVQVKFAKNSNKVGLTLSKLLSGSAPNQAKNLFKSSSDVSGDILTTPSPNRVPSYAPISFKGSNKYSSSIQSPILDDSLYIHDLNKTRQSNGFYVTMSSVHDSTPIYKNLNINQPSSTTLRPRPFQKSLEYINIQATTQHFPVTYSNYNISSARPFKYKDENHTSTAPTPFKDSSLSIYENIDQMISALIKMGKSAGQDFSSETPRPGLVVPPSVGPQTLHTLAVYFSNALDGIMKEKENLSEGEIENMKEELSTLLTQMTVHGYNLLFQPNGNEGETAMETTTKTLEDFQINSATYLAHSPEIRMLARNFSLALASYLDNPEMFQKDLQQLRPTEPSGREIMRLSHEVVVDEELLNFSDTDTKTTQRPVRQPSPTWGFILATTSKDLDPKNSLNQDLNTADSQSFIPRYNNQNVGMDTTNELPRDHWTTSRSATKLWSSTFGIDPASVNDHFVTTVPTLRNESFVKNLSSPDHQTWNVPESEVRYELRSLPQLAVNSTQIQGILIDFINTTTGESSRLHRLLKKLNTSENEFLIKMKEIESNPLTKRLILLLIGECGVEETKTIEETGESIAPLKNLNSEINGFNRFEEGKLKSKTNNHYENDQEVRALQLLNSLYSIASKFGK